MTYYYSSTKSYEFTSFSTWDCGVSSFSYGTKFTWGGTCSTTMTVKDDDSCLSSKTWWGGYSNDGSYQSCNIEKDGCDVGTGGKIYADSYMVLKDQYGNKYCMVEVRQEGCNDKHYTFYGDSGYCGTPPAGCQLTVVDCCKVTSDSWLRYDCLDGGPKELPPGTITGRLTYDADCNDNEWNDDKGQWDAGVAGQTVQLLDLNGNVVATSVTDGYGNYSFTVAAGDYRVKFPEIEGYKFSAKDSGVDEHYDSDADQNGLTDIISLASCQTICNIDAGVKLAGSIEGRIFCDLECDGLDGSSTVIPGKEYTMEAEGMYMYNFCAVNGAQASAGKLVKLACAGGSGDLWKNFNGASGTYDLKIFAQDENDGQSTIMVKVNGVVVGTIKLNHDSDGSGDDNGSFSAFVLQDVQINQGDKVQLWVDGNAGEYVRIDKIEFKGEDSIVTTVEPPKAGVEVKLLDADGNVVATTTTDADGNYKFGGLADGDYQVMATLPDGKVFTLKDVDGNVSDDIDSDVDDNGMSDTISIVDGNRVTDVDAGLCEAGSIAGRVFCDLECDGLDGSTKVVPGKEYTMEAEGMYMYNFCAVNGSQASEGKLVKLKCAGTNGDLWKNFNGDSGTYDLTVYAQDENDGQSTIMVKVNGVVVGTIKLNKDTDGSGDDNGSFSQFTLQDIQLNQGDKVQLWVDGNCSEYVRIDKIEFKGEDSTMTTVEPPKVGVEVKLLDAAGNVVATTTTDDQGNYKFDNLKDGDYKVMVTMPDGQEFTLQDVNGNAFDDIDSDVDATGMTDVISIMGGTDVTDIDAGVCDVKVGSLSGRYFMDTNDDDQDDNNGDEPAIAGVQVELLDANGVPTGITTFTDADGNYSFTDLDVGTYGVKFTDPNGVLTGKALVDANVGPDASDSDAIGDTVMSTITNIVVVAGQDTPDNDAGAENLPGSLSGRYFMDTNDNDVDDGQAIDMGIEGVLVELVDANGPTGVTTTTDSLGNYSFTGLAAGTYGVIFTDPNGVLAGKSLVNDNVGPDDSIDSDAIGNTTLSTIDNIVVTPGNDTPDNDAG
ncbi:MAG: carboxypeptidase regulatory-like domain-containing protein, partial [Gammaproteobacteria bacterium]|nr:carboxypeptidase regulatory-like domain-containing protein [Gammaproteobacteria bacterium]